ncbi:MAG: DUF7033 domain-containing protein, partial [bacterium]
IVEDHFFKYYKKTKTYLTKNSIPENIEFINNKFTTNLPIIYGTDLVEIKGDQIRLGFDIFASAFFMLTRWEEDIIRKNNKIGCNEDELLAVKYNFYQRPIINEYCVYLRDVLNDMGINVPEVKRKTTVYITHDVDWCYLSSKRKLMKNLAIMVYRKGLIKKSINILTKYLLYKISNRNPFDSFAEIMEITNKYGFNNHFYFKAVEKNEPGYTYAINEPKVKTILKEITEKGNHIGYHPSENTVGNDEQFDKELLRLKDAARTNIDGGRNHGLLYINQTYLQWNKNSLKYDSGVGFQFRNGFRSGTCYNYKLFDIQNRRTLNLKQIPMLVMDSVAIRKKMKPEKFMEEMKHIFDQVNNHNGTFCMNWHSNLFNSFEMRDYKFLYADILDYINKEIK